MMQSSKILIVEDDPGVRGLVETIVRRLGFEPHAAVDGLEGLDRLAVTDYALVVLDLMMPRMDGITFLQELQRRNDGTPVVVMSAAGDFISRLDMRQVSEVIRKPFEVSVLAAAIQEAVAPPFSGGGPIGGSENLVH